MLPMSGRDYRRQFSVLLGAVAVGALPEIGMARYGRLQDFESALATHSATLSSCNRDSFRQTSLPDNALPA